MNSIAPKPASVGRWTSSLRLLLAIGAPALHGQVKWNPGHYVQLGRGTAELSQSYRFGKYDEIGNETAIAGVVVALRWSQLEGASGDYAAGLALIGAELAKLKALPVPKRLIIRFDEKPYGAAGTGASAKYFPQYLLDAGYITPTGNGSAPKLYLPAVADRQIALMQAIAAAFDDEPYLEAVILTRENAVGRNFMDHAAGFAFEAYDAQLRRYYTAAKAAFRKTTLVSFENYYWSQDRTTAQLALAKSIGLGIGNPDLIPDGRIWIDRALRMDSGVNAVEYRGVIPLLWSIEASEMGLNSVGRKGGYTPQEFFDYANRLHVSHLMWDYNHYTGATGQRWSTGILPFIRTHPTLAHPELPAVYATTAAASADPSPAAAPARPEKSETNPQRKP